MRAALVAPTGTLTLIKRHGYRRAPMTWRLMNWLRHRLPDLPRLAIGAVAARCGVPVLVSRLRLVLRRASGEMIDYGTVSTRVVTTAGVNFIVDAFQNLVEVENMKYHGMGTGSVAEAAGDTALGAESTTALNPNNTRATGTTIEGASANIFSTVGTLSFDAAAAITEHGIFNQAATGGGTLLDRSVFATINVASGDSLQGTYDLTVGAGG